MSHGRNLATVLFFFGALAALACGSSSSNESPSTDDTGSPEKDASTTTKGKKDGGSTTDDDDAATDLDSGSSALDSGTSEDSGAIPADSGVVVPDAKRVFETSNTFKGDLKTAGAGTSGVDGADKICAAAALAASLGGSWKAWISSSTENAFTRIADVSPWYFVDRKTKVFASKTGGLQGALAVGPYVDINMNEFGVTNSPINAWTGTKVTGVITPTASPFTCNDWTSSAPASYEGLVGVSISFNVSWWTDSATNPCSNVGRLYCFEQ